MANDNDRLWVDSMPDAYERGLVPAVFRPFAVDLARRVAALSPQRILELAAGTGAVTRELLAALPDVEVTATDLNPAMVERGRATTPGARWQQADALDLPFDGAEFDVAVCQFGVMFFPDKARGFAEAARVLAPGGAVVMNSWGPLAEHDIEVAVVAALEAQFPDDPPRFLESVPHGYHDPEAIKADAEAGGLADVTVEHVVVQSGAASAHDLAAGYCTGTPNRGEIEARGDLAAATAAVAAEIERRLGAGPVTGRMTAYVVEGRVPS
jgi:SAM-dependent methyltransferase